MANAPQAADKKPKMIGFVVLGIVMLIWVLTWDSGDATSAARSQRPGSRA